MFTNDREAYRQFFFQTWQKHLRGLPLEPVEKQLVAVMIMHPEYHEFLAQAGVTEFEVEENPFMHMGLHMAVQEQIDLDRPAGVRECYQTLVNKVGDVHQSLHMMMTCLGKLLWQAQQDGVQPDENIYLDMIRKLNCD